MGKIDFSVGEFDTRVQFYKQEITRTDAGAIVKDFIKTTEAFAGVSSKTLDETVGGGFFCASQCSRKSCVWWYFL